jgi:hypothetical protein
VKFFIPGLSPEQSLNTWESSRVARSQSHARVFTDRKIRRLSYFLNGQLISEEVGATSPKAKEVVLAILESDPKDPGPLYLILTRNETMIRARHEAVSAVVFDQA